MLEKPLISKKKFVVFVYIYLAKMKNFKLWKNSYFNIFLYIYKFYILNVKNFFFVKISGNSKQIAKLLYTE